MCPLCYGWPVLNSCAEIYGYVICMIHWRRHNYNRSSWEARLYYIALWILMAWCFSTRASDATVLKTSTWLLIVWPCKKLGQQQPWVWLISFSKCTLFLCEWYSWEYCFLDMTFTRNFNMETGLMFIGVCWIRYNVSSAVLHVINTLIIHMIS